MKIQQSNPERTVVVTGCGVTSALGIGIDPLWDGLMNRVSGIRPIESFDPAGMRCQLGAEVPTFKMADYVPKNYRKSVKVMARDIELAVVCAHQAASDARLATRCLIDRGEMEGPPAVDMTRFGANIGAGLICADLQELAGALQFCGDPATGAFDLRKWGEEGMQNLTPLWLLKFLPNMLGCHVTIVHDAQAPSNTITCGEASSHLAIGEAFRTIARRAADVCICGGAESRINPMGIMRQELMGRQLDGYDGEPADACRPFDRGNDGTVVGEGGGLLILEEQRFAADRGARVYAEIAGFGAATQINRWDEPEADGTALALAIGNALADAGISPGDVDLIATMGTGCTSFDESELTGLRQVFTGRGDIPAVATRGAIGATGAGGGAIDLAIAALAIYHNTVPPSANTARSDTGGLLRFEPNGPVDAPINVAVSYAYSLCGNQVAAIVLRRPAM